MNPNFITAVEIASTLKISKALAYRLIAQGQIPSIRFGRTVRVRQEDLEEFILKKSAEPTADEKGESTNTPAVSDLAKPVSST